MENKTDLTLGSLFDGSGGFPLGGLLCGITPIWSSEVEPFAIRVTTKRLPKVKHLGDVSKIHGGEVEPVDIITFGSPCQDMSIAGKRAGLDGSRSNLFYEAIRIVKEMRCATDGKYPRYIVWENVPGAFSSNGGEDFRSVLEAVCSVKGEFTIPVPPKGKWTRAGEIVGDSFSAAWRTLDAQYWGVPQRRRRIYLVADFAGECAGKLLFESEGVSGYPPQSFCPWKRTAGTAADCAGAASCEICLNDQGGQQMDVSEGVTGTLRARMDGHPPLVFENHAQDSRYTGPLDVAATVAARYGTGGNNLPFVVDTPKTLKIRSGCEGGGKGALVQNNLSATLATNNDQTVFVPKAYGICSKSSHSMLSDNPHSGFYEANTSRTLDQGGGNPTCNQGGIAVVAHPTYCMTTGSFTEVTQERTPTLMARDYKDPPIINEPQTGSGKEVVGTLSACMGTKLCLGNQEAFSGDYHIVEPEYVVRRLTPTECARLQGFPDWWCADLGTKVPTQEELDWWADVFETQRRISGASSKPKTRKQIFKWLQNPHSDAAEYRLWGNGVALPCVCFVLAGIVYYTQNPPQ